MLWCVISNSYFRYSGDVNDQRSPLPASMSSLSLNKSNDTVVVNSKPFNKTRFVCVTKFVLSIKKRQYIRIILTGLHRSLKFNQFQLVVEVSSQHQHVSVKCFSNFITFWEDFYNKHFRRYFLLLFNIFAILLGNAFNFFVDFNCQLIRHFYKRFAVYENIPKDAVRAPPPTPPRKPPAWHVFDHAMHF